MGKGKFCVGCGTMLPTIDAGNTINSSNVTKNFLR